MKSRLTKERGIGAHLPMVSTWKSSLFIFGLLIIFMLIYFLWQIRHVNRVFLSHVREDAKMAADVIRLNARGAVLSQEIIEEMMQTFLGNTIHFIDFLDAVESFSEDELAAFAAQAGLAGIQIVRETGSIVEGPPDWLEKSRVSCQNPNRSIHHNKNAHLYLLVRKRQQNNGCIIAGITADRIEKLQMQSGLPFALNSLSQLAGILYVRIRPSETPDSQALDIPKVKLIDTPALKAAEVQIALGDDVLKIGLQAEHYFRRIKQLWSEFILLSVVLAALGLFFAWLLHRYQSAYLNQVRHFERRIARHREDAVLGRAAAAITHEIRNPLNAIGMGLQRLQMEAGQLETEHQSLIRSMLQAVNRTDNIVSNIRRYAKPLTLNKKPLKLDSLVSEVLCLYEQQCKAHQIKLNFKVNCDTEIIGDRELLEEVIENLVKNGIEAQPSGGYLNVNIDKQDTDLCLSMENGGFPLSALEAQRIMEPYFTTKAKGTGLGLAIAQRIMTAHGGRINVEVFEEVVRMSVFLRQG
ncbi:ATP-binding protein [Desulfococcaceae bacterium HSG7]|nr:ATP-binding protein [Desulfococcaceae bacterium HSG7]